MSVKKVNRMDDFEIDEVSSVDKPAQEPAIALLLKAKGDTALRKRLRMLSDEDGHTHLIDDSEDGGHTSHDTASGAEYGHSHPWVRNDDGTISIGMADGHKHSVIAKGITEQDLARLSGESASSGGGQDLGENSMTKTAEEIAAEAKATNERIQKAEARAEKAEKLASLTDVQKNFYSTLSGEAQDGFLDSTSDERQSAVEKAAGEDPIVYTTLAGEDIRKSAGSVILSLAKRADESEKQLAVEKAAREHDTFVKQAQEKCSNLPGEQSAQVALMKAIAGIPNDQDREGALEIIKAADDHMTKSFKEMGTSTGGSGSDAEGKLEKMAQEHFTANGGSYVKSYRAVLETDEGRKLYQETRA